MIGKELKETGNVVMTKEIAVSHPKWEKGGVIPKHNHPGYSIFFTVVKGKMQVFMNEEEEHILEPGTVLNFNGENYISGKALEDSDVFIFLSKFADADVDENAAKH